MAGIKAARILENAGLNVTILEGRHDRYGGRIWTNYEAMNGSTGAEVDMGASWICDDGIKNTGMKISLAQKIPTVFSDFLNPILYHGNDSRVHDDDWKNIYKDYRRLMFDELPLSIENWDPTTKKNLKITDGDISLKVAIRTLGYSKLLSDPVFAFLNSHLIEADIGAEMGLTSAKMFEDITAKNTRIIPQGYAVILKPLVDGSNGQEQPLKILLDKEVISIKFDKNYKINETDRWLRITTKKGDLFKSRAVIITVPLGVLKANTIIFDEKLISRNVKRSIGKLGFGLMNKIHLKFNEIFWPKSYHAFGLLPNKDSCKYIKEVRSKYTNSTRTLKRHATTKENPKRKHISNANNCSELDASLYHSWINGYLYTGQKVLIGYATGKAARLTEALSDDNIKNIALDKLREIFGKKKLNKIKVAAMVRTKWLQDRFARGTWTYHPTGSTSADLESFSQIKGPLFIAGEHTNPENYGTVTGAHNSGIRAARAVLDYLYKNYHHEYSLENIDPNLINID